MKNQIKFGKIWLGIGSCAACLPMVASAQLVQDGNFGAPSGGASFTTYYNGSTMGSWTVGAGSVDLIGGYWEAPFPGQQSVDMAGFYQNGTIKQDISGLTVGQTYALTFYLAGNPDGLPADKTLDVSFGGAGKSYTFVTTPTTTHSNMGWELETEDFVANSTSEWLVFADASATLPDGSPTAFGAVIGDVSLTAVPEPSTVFAGVLLLLPLGVSAIRVLRRDRTV